MNIMKKMVFLCAVVALLMLTACTKQVNCRCAVRGTANTSRELDVRVITVSSRADCRDIYYVVYDRSEIPEDHGLVDSLFCTDYPFDVTVIDSTVTVSNGAK